MFRLLLSLFLLINIAYANKKYCTKYTDKQRSTLIYLDVSNTEYKKFALNLLSELKNSLLPHERVRVFTINPNDVTVNEVFNSCAPILTIEERKKVKAEGSFKYMLGGNPIEAAKEDYSFFMAELKSTLARIYKNSIDLDSKKEIIEMLYSESSTFDEKAMQRVILYSDMIQNSNIVTSQAIVTNSILEEKIKEYIVDFNNAEFYIYTGKKKFNITKHNNLMNFWKGYFEQNNGFVNYYNDSLKLNKFKYQISKVYEGQLDVNGKKFESKIYLNFNENRKTTNSWFIINELDSIPIKGIVSLVKGKLTAAKLKTNLIQNKNHTLFTGDEKFIIKIKSNKLVGEIKIDNTEVILNGEEITNPVFKFIMKEVKS